MLPHYGKRNARIAKFNSTKDHCRNCNAFDLEVNVYRDYHFFMFIPVLPTGEKTSRIYCNRCGEGMRIETVKKNYEFSAKTPFWFYSLFILIALILVVAFSFFTFKEHQYDNYVTNPKVGDVYKIRGSQQSLEVFYFLKVSRLKEDSVFMYPSHLSYLMEPDEISDEDYFHKEVELSFSRKNMQVMRDTSGILSIER